MSMFMSDYDVEALLQFAIRHTANTLRIEDPSWKTPKELLAEIESVDPQTHAPLAKFCEAYLEWYRYVKQIGDLGKNGNLDRLEQEKLFHLMQQRDATRSTILARIKSLN